MKHSAGIKIIAIILAALSLAAAFGSGLGVILVAESDLYTGNLDDWENTNLEDRAITLANRVLERYTAITLGNCTTQQLKYIGRSYTDEEFSGWYNVDPAAWDYTIYDSAGRELESTGSGRISGDIRTFSFTMSCEYPVHASASEVDQYEFTGWNWRDYYTDDEEHYIYYFPSPAYTVTIRMLPDALVYYNGLTPELAGLLFNLRFWFIGILAASLVLLIASSVYLGFAAGHNSRDTQLNLYGLTRLPLDLYAAAVCGLGFLLVYLAAWILETFFFTGNNSSLLSLIPVGAIAVAAAVLVIAFCYALTAQLKMGGGCWWRRSLVGRILRWIWRGVRFCFRGARKLINMLPLIWQWLLTAVAMVLIPLLFLLLAAANYGFGRAFFMLWFVAAIFADIAMVCYGAYAFGILLKGAKRMQEGDLNAKVPTKYLFGSFLEFAGHLNALADVATVAAKKQMQSERMKTELITNVSHDIKTPLTSIINYVDLLEKPHTEEEGTQYLEVLSRQSLRLKKLIDDLMDMSKATSGAMQVDITQVDAVEAINQALGEFSDKLDAAQLRVIFQPPEAPVAAIRADGRLTWRVLSNLLGNIVKYALPGTRVYIDLAQMGSCVAVSLKNISKEPLNVSAEELTERFVRGDASRNTEGSGLGLNIAQSLMELQKGQLNLLVDGDLFKVTLIFPIEA